MSVQGSVVVNATDGNETLVHEAMSSLMRAAKLLGTHDKGRC